MTSPSPKVTDHFEVLVLGGRLSGWIAAKIMADRGFKVGLIHHESDLGQEYKILQTPLGSVAEGFLSLPSGPGRLEELEKLSAELGCLLEVQLAPEGLQTFDSGKAKPFLGFGDAAPECMAILEPYMASQYHFFEAQTLETLFRFCQEGPQHLSPHDVTSLKRAPEGWYVELDHQKTYLADQVFYCQSPSQLQELLRSPGSRPSKDLRSLSRWEPWSSLSLTLVHQPQSVSPYSPWLLMGSKLEPVLGVFEAPIMNRQVSHWLSFLPAEVASSEEACATLYKEMKRQIKRAFPEGVLEAEWEKISVDPQSHGPSVWPLGGRELNLGENLHLLGPAFSTHEHPLWAELLSPLEVTSAREHTAGQTEAPVAENPQI